MSSSNSITQKITAVSVMSKSEVAEVPALAETKSTLIEARPEVIEGKTYKIKPPTTESAFYITINDFVNDDGTKRPMEMFIVSKDVESFQWISALTRLTSAIFRHTPDVSFVAKELQEVFDPRGGYFIPCSQGKHANSIVAHIGVVLEMHFRGLGIGEDGPDENQLRLIKEKSKAASDATSNDEVASSYPESASLCAKCHTKAVVRTDGCNTCLSCGDSKCS